MPRPPIFKLNISNQLLFFFAAVMLVMMVLLAAFSYVSKSMDTSIEQVSSQTLVVNEQLNKIRQETSMIVAGIHDALLDWRTDSQSLSHSLEHPNHNIAQALERLHALLVIYDNYVSAYFPDEAPLRDKVFVHAAALELSAKLFIAPSVNPNAMSPEDILFLRQDIHQTERALMDAIDAALAHEQMEMAERNIKIKTDLNQISTVIWASFIGLGGIFMAVALFITRRIIGRINKLRAAATKIGDAELSVRINDTGHDELSDLSHVFDDMAARLQAMMQSRDTAEENLRQLTNRLESLVLARTQEINRAKEQAEHASQAKTKFLSSMSHELRTPLNAISGFGQMLRMAVTPAPQRDEYVDIILQNSQTLLALIDQVLVLSSIADEPLSLTLQPVPLDQALDKSLALTTHIAREYGVKVKDQCDRTALPHVLADEEHLVTIIVNLLTNAIKYNQPQNGWVTIQDKPVSGEMHRIIITDGGTGFIEDYPGQILEPFERLAQYGTTIDGAGVGLTIVNSFLSNINGTLGYETIPGKGSTFWVELPLAHPGDQTS